jgi:hypothetical protein
MSTLLLLATLAGGTMAAPDLPAQTRAVVVNRQKVPDTTLAALERGSASRIPDGHYWYDAFSGAWGLEGGPTAGFIMPGLPLGGRLAADASGGAGPTGVFINGRELHPLDVQGLRAITGTVLPGRYWVNAQGIGGYEGGPPLFDLRAMAAQAQRYWRQNGGTGENHGGGAWSYNNSNTGIGVISDGEGGMVIFDH